MPDTPKHTDPAPSPLRRLNGTESAPDPAAFYLDLHTRALAGGRGGVRIRIAPALLDTKPGQVTYRSWPGVSWTIESGDVEDGMRLREALDQFFLFAETQGLDALADLLEQNR